MDSRLKVVFQAQRVFVYLFIIAAFGLIGVTAEIYAYLCR